MGILCAILSLPVSILLIRWLMKKKTENPFEKGDVRRLIIAGMLSMVVAAVVTLLIIVIRAYRLIGIDTLKLWMSNPDPETVKTSLTEIRSRAAGQTSIPGTGCEPAQSPLAGGREIITIPQEFVAHTIGMRAINPCGQFFS